MRRLTYALAQHTHAKYARTISRGAHHQRVPGPRIRRTEANAIVACATQATPSNKSVARDGARIAATVVTITGVTKGSMKNAIGRSDRRV